MCRSPGNNKTDEISGFELAFLVTNSTLPHGAARVLSQLANLAACTPNFFISRSHKRIAEETNCSESTVRRAFKWAVDSGMLIKQTVVHEKTNARLPNMYSFSPSFLAYARDVKAKLLSRKLTFFSPIKAVREVIDSVRALLNFNPQPHVQNEQPPHVQNEQDKNKNSPLRKTKTSDPGEPDSVNRITRREMFAEIAAAKAAGANQRKENQHAFEHMLNAIADKKAQGFAWAKWLREREKHTSDLFEPSYNFEGLPASTTISEMMKRCKNSHETSTTKYRVPKGFRG